MTDIIIIITFFPNDNSSNEDESKKAGVINSQNHIRLIIKEYMLKSANFMTMAQQGGGVRNGTMSQPQQQRRRRRRRGLDCLFLLVASSGCVTGLVTNQQRSYSSSPSSMSSNHAPVHSPSPVAFFKQLPSLRTSSQPAAAFLGPNVLNYRRDTSELYVATHPYFLDELYDDISSTTKATITNSVPPSTTVAPPRTTRTPQSQDDQQVTKTTIHGLTMWEVYWISMLNVWYDKSQKIKCPFGRRRFGDVLDQLENVIRTFGLVRYNYQHLMGPMQSCQPIGNAPSKTKDLPTKQVLESIRKDWYKGKGYYVNGKLTTSIYRDDCLFDGPDPDMPVKGLRKYIGVAALLFDPHQSNSELLSLEVQDPKTIHATWNMDVTIKLPWRPAISKWKGTTTYHLDDDNLIYRHQETWEMPVSKAFTAMMEPLFEEKNNNKNNRKPSKYDNNQEEEEEEDGGCQKKKFLFF